MVGCGWQREVFSLKCSVFSKKRKAPDTTLCICEAVVLQFETMRHHISQALTLAVIIFFGTLLATGISCSSNTESQQTEINPPRKRVIYRPESKESLTSVQIEKRLVGHVPDKVVDKNGNLILFASNQSFEIPTVDIKIWIDDRLVVDDLFPVKNQHNWIGYQIAVNPGTHTLVAKSEKGGGEFQTEFAIQGKHWAAVNYWGKFEDESSGKSEAAYDFMIQDKPIDFI